MKYVDLHCDTLQKISSLYDFINMPNLAITPEKLIEGNCCMQCFAIWSENPTISYLKEKVKVFRSLRTYLSEFGIKACLTVENGDFLQGKVENVRELAILGVRMLTLLWNYPNLLGECHGYNNGLTSFGKNVIEACFRYGIIVDASHLSERGFYQVASMAKNADTPFCASHSCAAALCPNTRNLTDFQLRTIADGGGVVGINFYQKFLGDFSVMEHIKKIINLCGEDCVAFGTDADGAFPLSQEYKDMSKLTDLIEKEYGTRIAEKICYKNAYRLLEI